MSDVIVDLQKAIERRRRASVEALVTEARADVFGDLRTFDVVVRGDAPMTAEQLHRVIEFLADTVRTGLFGYGARAWAASLLVRLRDTRGAAIAATDAPVLEEAAAALAAFDAVAFGSAAPGEMRAFLLTMALESPRR